MVSGGTTWRRMVELIGRGAMVRCSRTNTYYPQTEMVPDDRGGFIAKKFDNTIHDQTIKQSKFKKGPGWQRGIEGGQ